MRRLNPALMPTVFPSHAQKGYSFRALDERYAGLPKTPLKITAHMISPTVANGGNGIHLDGVLTGAVMGAHPCSYKFDSEYTLIPLPLEILWMDGDLPLWAASDLIPDKIIPGSEYWHKRYPGDRIEFARKRNANTSAGRWRDYRVPLKLNATHQFIAYAIGNRDEVERLLSGYCDHLGKKGSIGYGRVAKWEVVETDDCMREIHSNRVLPAEYARARGLKGKLLPSASWTPPYWYRPNQCACVDMRV